MNSTMKLRIAAGAGVCSALAAHASALILTPAPGGPEAVAEVAPGDDVASECGTEVVTESSAPAVVSGVNFTVAAACPPGESDEAHRLHTVKPHTSTRSSHHVVIKQDRGDGEVFELKMGDGDIVILRNGNRVHENHIKKFPGKVMVLGDGGDELTTFELEGMGQAPKAGSVQKLWFSDGAKHGNVVIAGDADHAFAFSTDANVQFGGAHPPVMLGIMLGEPGPALRYHLGLKSHDAILVEGVTEGLAADRAGLKAYDVIVSVDGSGEANGKVLHEALSKKNPGDELRIIVMRGCDKVRLTADLDEYNASKLSKAEGNARFDVAPHADEDVFKFRVAPPSAPTRPFVWNDDRGELLRSLHEKLRGHMSEEQLEQTHKALKEALGKMDFDFEFGPGMGGAGVMEFKWDGKDHKLVIPKSDQWRALAEKELPQLHREMEHKAEDAQRRAAEMQERLSERLERLSEEIERLRESIEDRD